jgi:L-alanine-DL-glutamate epimerase-like enolase superfamily enzyme
MRALIASIETQVARYPIVGAFKFLASSATRDTVLVKITDDAGNVGWGQSVPSPSWSYETIETVQSTIEWHLAPVLIGLDAFDIVGVWCEMNRAIAGSYSIGQPICKAGIDLALFDLTGKILGQTPAERWGRTGAADSVTLSWTLDPGELSDVESGMSEAQARGYRHFNVKIGRGQAFDLEVCRRVRELAPEAFVWVDANGGYDADTAAQVAPRLADLGIAAFEQPLPANRLTGYRMLRQQGALPILMDEGIVSLADLEEFHRLELLDGVAMKVSRSGGLTEARKMVEFLLENGLQFFASGLTDPDVSLAASLHLFAAYGLPHPAALNGPQYLEELMLETPITVRGDRAFVPVGTGLGVAVRA